MILYFTYWFPSKYRSRVIAALFLAVPGANALTAVVSGAILQMDGIWGLRGWQWLFIVEAIPAILLAFAVLALMTERPAKANWLAPEEREWLEGVLESERSTKVKAHGEFTLYQALTNSTVLLLASIYFTIGGFVGPYAVGWIKDATGSFEAGLYFLAACSLASAVIAFFGLRPAVVELKKPIALELAK
jgi:MFS family permease